MTDSELQTGDEISLFVIGTTLLRNRWRILRWMLVGAAVAALTVLVTPRMYSAFASFVPQGGDASRSGLATIAGQFGVAIPNTNQSLSPEFYARLLQSRVVLLPIARDTFVMPEMGGKRVPFLELVKIKEGSAERREEQGVRALKDFVGVSIVKTTGVVEFSVATQWRSISLAIAAELLKGVNDYNERTRQGQAAAERRFVEGRLAVASADLRQAEDRLEGFLRTNRQISNSPELTFERDRLQRDVSLRQQVFTSLTQSYEDARIREVRDTPVITVFEQPSVQSLPGSRGGAKRVLLGVMLGAFIGTLLAFTSGLVARRREEGDTAADEFANTLKEMKGAMLRPVRSLRRQIGQ